MPTHSAEEQPLQNILSVSTAGRNRYLLHFNSHHSLSQWTAAIILARFEHATLQEAYTGALIAGKGKTLNNIGVIMERSRMKVEGWVRVRFGAGVPWKRCWCAISPPDEKEYAKLQKEMKKRSPYDRSHPPTLKGDIRFYDNKVEGKKQKKAKPIATITDAYSAYAIYPQAKSLIDASTLIKIEGDIMIHSDPPSVSEGFVFIMPEVNPAVSGFEMMLRHLFPTWDTFGLYGRPGRLVASTIDPRSLMFAMPKHRRYGYLEIMDVAGLIMTEGSSGWSEKEWRKRLKDLTGQRMTSISDTPGSASHSRANSRTDSQAKRQSFVQGGEAAAKGRVGFADSGSPSDRSSRSMSLSQRPAARNDSAPPGANRLEGPSSMAHAAPSGHTRNASDSSLAGAPPPPPPHLSQSPGGMDPMGRGPNQARAFMDDQAPSPYGPTPDSDAAPPNMGAMGRLETPEPVSRPPAFSHAPGYRPNQRPHHHPEMRRANSRMSMNTLNQLAQAGGIAEVGQQNGWDAEEERRRQANYGQQRGPPPPVHAHAMNAGMTANTGTHKDVINENTRSPGLSPPALSLNSQSSKSSLKQDMVPQSPGYRGPIPGAHSMTPDLRSPPRGPGAPGTPGSEYHPQAGRGQPPPMMNGRGTPPVNMGPPPNRGPPGGPQSPQMGRGYYRGPPGPGGPSSRPTTPGSSHRSPPPSHTTSPPIHRKPLPARSDSLPLRQSEDGHPPGSAAASSNGSFTRDLDPGILAHLNGYVPPPESPQLGPVRRHNTGHSVASSSYDSTGSPDYASTRPSTDTATSAERVVERVERPRAGVLRTVGEAPPPVSQTKFDIPSVDFGSSINYGPNAACNKTPTPIVSPPPTGPFSPAQRSHSPGIMPPRRSPALESTSDRHHSDDSGHRSVPWHPAAAAASRGPSPGLSAEQYVQQRAATATPLYSHQRQVSANTLNAYRAGTPTPPLERSQARDYMSAHAHSRSNSQDLLQRPSSRTAGAILGGHGSQRDSQDPVQRPSSRAAGAILGGQGNPRDSHLSAREQEHVARVTGTPLVNMAGNRNSAQQQQPGLVGAIEAREREKQQMKQGYSGHAVQQAINQRQLQQSYQNQNYGQPLGSPGLPPPAGMYSSMYNGRGMTPSPQSPGPQGYGFPQNFVSPGAQAYSQGGGWSSPGPSPMLQGGYSPGFVAAPGQYSPQFNTPGQGQQRVGQQMPGRGQGYSAGPHGQAF